jgi:hypothetical protein
LLTKMEYLWACSCDLSKLIILSLISRLKLD